VGIKPKQLESGCGWILKGSRIFHESLKINEVNEFVEKPDLQTTRELFNKDSLLNTFIMIGKSRTFLNYLRKYTPKLFNSFLPLLINKIPERERFLVGRIFLTVPMINFSYDFLTKICKHLSVVELSDIYWSDWGDENRIINDLKRIYNNKEYEIPLSVEEVIIFN
jgi:mannose-1-phosphate guanylyltransferase